MRTRLLRQRWDRGEVVDLEQEGDVSTVASLLKLFLRELPGALIPEPQRKDLVASLAGTETGAGAGAGPWAKDHTQNFYFCIAVVMGNMCFYWHPNT